MADQPLRVGLLGAGGWARRVHVPNLAATPDAVLSALCTRSADNAAATRELAGEDLPWFDDRDQFLADAPCDAVIISSPNWTHEPFSIQALAAGKHVLCEKPIALTDDGCARLGDVVEHAGRTFQVGFELRYADVPTVLRDQVASGRLGRVVMFTAKIRRNWQGPAGWRADRERSGGLFGELLCHYTDLAAFVLDAQPVRLSVAGGYVCSDQIPEYAAVSLAYPHGAVADITVCQCAPTERKEIYLEVLGDAGWIEAELLSGKVTFLDRTTGRTEDLSPAREADYHVDGYPGSLESLAAFAECVRTGATPRADLAAGRAAVRTALACQHSLDHDQEVVRLDL